MAKIDVSQIEGYSDMSAEEKVALFEGFEYDDHSGDVDKYKKAFDKASSDIADLKKQLKAKMTDEEVKTKENAEAFEKLKNDHEALLKEVNLSKTTNKYLELGYDKDLATATAQAFIDGDMDRVFANQKAYQDTLRKTFEKDALGKTPRPANGDGTKTVSKEDFAKMGYDERVKFKAENPDLYKSYTN